MSEQMATMVPEPWQSLFAFLTIPLSWIPGMQQSLLSFVLFSPSGWLAGAYYLFLLFPILLWIGAVWCTQLSIYTLPFRSGRIDLIKLMLLAWWDAALATYLAAYDLGPEPADLGARPWYDSPRGLNLAVRRDALLAVGGFNLRLGPRADRPSVGEESDLCLRLLARGHEIRYVPGAAVEHLVDPARLHPRWFFQRAFWTGWSEAMVGLAHRRLRKVAGLLRWHYRLRAFRLPYRPRGEPEAARVRAECERREALGYLLGLLRWAPVRGRLVQTEAGG